MDALALRSRLAGVALAVLLVGLCVAVRLLIDRWVGELLPFSLFTLAVVGSALLGGFVAGVVATLLSAFAAVVTLFGPAFPFGLDQPRVRIGLVLFCAVNLIVSAVCERSRRARVEAQEGMEGEARTRRLLE